MMSIVLIAVMLDPPALTMRNVALAALAILVVAPESLFDVSFQMSFAAVVGLVAFYEWFSGLDRTRLRDASPIWGSAQRAPHLSPAPPPRRSSPGPRSRPSRSTTSIA
jgi:predicted membrane metal-binding protein